MKSYIGTKRIQARPMTRLAYNEYRGWELPSDESGSDEGYLVEYQGSSESQPNHENHTGYISWSPKAQFEEAYKCNGGLSYGDAIYLMERGCCVCREGWNGADMFVTKQVPQEIAPEIVECMTSLNGETKAIFQAREQGPSYGNQMIIVKSDGTVDSWVASSSDTFAKDWCVYGAPED